MRILLFALFFGLSSLFGLSGCGTYVTGLGHDAAKGALAAITDDDAKKQIASLTAAARDEALGQTTDDRLQKLVNDTGETARTQLDSLITAEIDKKLRPLLRSMIDDA